MSEEQKGFDFPIGFMNEMDLGEKNKILKAMIEAVADDLVDVNTIPNPKLRAAFVSLMIEADKAAKVSEAKLDFVMSGAAKENRAKRRAKSAKERAKEAGLVVLEPNVPNAGKLIIE